MTHAARQALGMTGLVFAAAVGHSQRSVWRWEAGEAPIPGSVRWLVKIMRASPEGLALVLAASRDTRHPVKAAAD